MKHLTYAATRTAAKDCSRTDLKSGIISEAPSAWDLTLEALEQSRLIEVIPEAVPRSEEFVLNR